MAAIGAAIGAIFSAFSASSVGAFLTSTIVGRLVVSIGASLLLQAIAGKPKVAAPGIRTSTTQTGGQTSESFILGTYATGGSLIAPPMSQGRAGDTPNAYLTYVIELSSVPGCTLDGLIIDDEEVTLGGSPHADYGTPVQGRYEGFAWIKYYDGSQVAADPMLIDKYGDDPARPWSADMKGTGLCYAILTFRYSAKRFNGLPRVRFVIGGIPLYDPRKDTTVGGSGTHRWADKATWEPSGNPIVQAYNLLRGIALPDGSIYGGGFPAGDLPLAPWFAAMNECDVMVDNGAGGLEAQFRTGFEVLVAEDEPADVLVELFKASAAQITDVAGTWKPRVGPVALPVLSFSDADILASEADDFAPFPGLAATFNAVHASYPEPASLWETRDAPPRYNPDWEAEDQGRRLVADLALPACPYGNQVQRIMHAYIADERRFRRHGLTLPPEALTLEPLDSVAWTSARNGYAAKVFEVTEIAADLVTGLQRLSLRERDAADFVYPVDVLLPTTPPPTGLPDPTPQTVPGFAAIGTTVLDATGAVRGPAIRLSWTAAEAEDVPQLRWELRPVSQAFTLAGVADVETGAVVVAQGVVRNGSYEARAELIADRPTAWTAWTLVTAPDVAAVYPPDLEVGVLAVQGFAAFGGSVASDNYLAGTAGWRIAQDGSVEFNGGLATFGGNLQSSNFVAGTAGWRITQAGAAEFNNLINRAALQAGAVSDKFNANLATSTTNYPLGSLKTIVTLTVGRMSPGQTYYVGASFNHNGTRGTSCLIERRFKFTSGGGFVPWEQVTSVFLPADASDRALNMGAFQAGDLFDVEYRLSLPAETTGGGSLTLTKINLNCQVILK